MMWIIIRPNKKVMQSATIIDLTAVLIEERIIKQEERNRQKTVFCDVQIKMQIYAQCL